MFTMVMANSSTLGRIYQFGETLGVKDAAPSCSQVEVFGKGSSLEEDKHVEGIVPAK
jgi:hypothetical protein